MSWSTSVSGVTKSDTLQQFQDKMNSDGIAHHCPVKDALVRSATDLAAAHPEGMAMKISTFGHLNADGSGNIQLAINC